MHGRVAAARWMTAGLIALTAPAWAAGPGETQFSRDCAACHTLGQGDRSGPDLLGVTRKRDRAWLQLTVRAPSRLLEEGDPLAGELVERFDGVPMPDQPLTEEQVEQVLGYIEACTANGGCDLAPERPPRGSEAGVSAVEQGRLLFEGRARFLRNGAPCALCHDARATGLAGGGSLGPDLTFAYGRLGDLPLAQVLAEPAAGPMERAYRRAALTEAESYAVRGFLAATAREGEPTKRDHSFYVLVALGLVAVLGLLRTFGPSSTRPPRPR